MTFSCVPTDITIIIIKIFLLQLAVLHLFLYRIKTYIPALFFVYHRRRLIQNSQAQQHRVNINRDWILYRDKDHHRGTNHGCCFFSIFIRANIVRFCSFATLSLQSSCRHWTIINFPILNRWLFINGIESYFSFVSSYFILDMRHKQNPQHPFQVTKCNSEGFANPTIKYKVTE